MSASEKKKLEKELDTEIKIKGVLGRIYRYEVLRDRAVNQVTADAYQAYIDRLEAEVEGLEKAKNRREDISKKATRK